ncbi:MAG: helix-turn-helix domain-containing protein [Candidatus Nitrohelix vancouverensis]|uniref:Helix-turn-helix domain-containing protein n=1 Tax=Candidatus Nitrohelix vancouverensis TaxID=2705534 RepID=A0A7T0C209_9BACT|nr:MAG: helix-turn-helix domain-containing protein [Candidatus Nitrohelix vancouverensis]
MNEDFGSYLKKERELRGVPLEEIAGATKVHIQFLRAIEDNKLDQLPGEVFIKGYIRSYAKAIGSDVDEVLNVYDEAIGKLRKKKINDLEIEQANINAKSGNSVFKGLLMLVGVAAFVGGVYFLISNLPKSAKPEKATIKTTPAAPSIVEPATEVSEPAPAPVMDTAIATSDENAGNPVSNDALETPSTPAAIEPAPQTPAALAPEDAPESSEISEALKENQKNEVKRYKLTIVAEENSWFKLLIDGERDEDFILPAGTRKEYQGDKNFIITIGNKNGVQLTLNGEPLQMPPSEDNVIRDFNINPNNEG